MAAERHSSKDDPLQSGGRTDNAARNINDAPDNEGATRYPAVNKDDSVDITGEGRSFGSDAPANPQPRQGAGDSSLHPADPSGDDAEGRR